MPTTHCHHMKIFLDMELKQFRRLGVDEEKDGEREKEASNKERLAPAVSE